MQIKLSIIIYGVGLMSSGLGIYGESSIFAPRNGGIAQMVRAQDS